MYSFIGPLTLTLVGSPGAGKSFTIFEMCVLRNKLFSCKETDPPMKIMFFYSMDQPIYEQMRNEFKTDIIFKKGIPCRSDIDELTINREYQSMVILDDLFQEVYKNSSKLNFMWFENRRFNLNTIFVTHNYTMPGSRVINLNTTAILLFRSVFAAGILQTICRQAFVGKTKLLKICYDDVMTSSKWGFLVIDFSAHCDDEYRIRSNILTEKDETVIYVME